MLARAIDQVARAKRSRRHGPRRRAVIAKRRGDLPAQRIAKRCPAEPRRGRQDNGPHHHGHGGGNG